MFKTFICCLIFALCLCINVGVYAGDEEVVQDNAIPNLTLDPQDNNGNGENVKLQGDKDGEELTPVERRVIVRDAVRSNAQSVLGN